MKELEGLNFDEIPERMQIRINETELDFAIIGPDSPPGVQRNIFKRLNTGGLPLTEQEIRHALYFGPVTDLLARLVETQEFRQEKLHNLWGQEDISAIITHCLEDNKNTQDRFKSRFNADFCPGALNSAPDFALWEKQGFFETMDRAKEVNYKAVVRFIKSAQVDKTKHGSLMELRCMGSGHRIFFVHRENCSPRVLIGGFYQKNESQSESDAIKTAKRRIDEY